MAFGFPKKLIPAVLCQRDLGALEIDNIQSGNEETISSGHLRCVKCNLKYKIDVGILKIIDNQEKIDDILVSEIQARNGQAEIYDQRLETRHNKEIPSTLSGIGDLSGKNVIEYGCGTGRITKLIVDKTECLLAIDFSLQSLLVLARKLGGAMNVGLVQADATQFKTANEYFDTALSIQFYEHIPAAEQRSKFLDNVRTTIKKNSSFVSTCYHFDIRRKIKGLPQEGRHSSGIFYHYFTRAELEKEFSSHFKVTGLHPIDITLPLEARFSFLKPWGGCISRICESLPFLNDLGHLLIIKADKNG